MDCNKDEATRAKVIAERKLEQKDYSGAKKFALKAQALYPELDGISHMLTTLDVYVSAENKMYGEMDSYSVLGVNPTADDDTIKKQYRKLALLLHPDKNKSIGADGAFKLISEAWSKLSDPAKRLEYNKKRGYNGFQQDLRTRLSAMSRPKPNVPTQSAGPSAAMPTQQRGRTTSVPMAQNRSGKGTSKPTHDLPEQRKDTFWTTCYGCTTQYEYLKIYLNCTLLCLQCQNPFMASDTGRPLKFVKSRLRQMGSVNNSVDHNAFDPRKSGAGQACQSSLRHENNQQELKTQHKRSHAESFETAVSELIKKSKLDQEKYGCNSFAGNAKEHPKMVPVNVPCAEFHNFDTNRCESSFSDNEIWAAYDNDGMPCIYALINKVISRDPFILRISWLNSNSHSESNVGEFSVGEHEMCASVNAFSHRVSWSKNHKGIMILPKKDEIWALRINGPSVFEMVMVLDNFCEERGVPVAPVAKVAGFRTLFLPNLDQAVTRQLKKEEISLFSHRVPHYFLSREEAPHAPIGSVELDPAATPLEIV